MPRQHSPHVRKMRSDKVRRPRPGDQQMVDANNQPTNAVTVPKRKRKNPPQPFAQPRRGKGKGVGWYEIRGARAILGHKPEIWIHAASDDDACGTFRVSKLFREGDDLPVPTGLFQKGKLKPGQYGFIRCGPLETREVDWRNADRIIKKERQRRAGNAARRRRRAEAKAAQAA